MIGLDIITASKSQRYNEDTSTLEAAGRRNADEETDHSIGPSRGTPSLSLQVVNGERQDVVASAVEAEDA